MRLFLFLRIPWVNGNSFEVTSIERLRLIRTDINHVRSSSPLLLSLNPVFLSGRRYVLYHATPHDPPIYMRIVPHDTITSFLVSFWNHLLPVALLEYCANG